MVHTTNTAQVNTRKFIQRKKLVKTNVFIPKRQTDRRTTKFKAGQHTKSTRLWQHVNKQWTKHTYTHTHIHTVADFPRIFHLQMGKSAEGRGVLINKHGEWRTLRKQNNQRPKGPRTGGTPAKDQDDNHQTINIQPRVNRPSARRFGRLAFVLANSRLFPSKACTFPARTCHRADVLPVDSSTGLKQSVCCADELLRSTEEGRLRVWARRYVAKTGVDKLFCKLVARPRGKGVELGWYEVDNLPSSVTYVMCVVRKTVYN